MILPLGIAPASPRVNVAIGRSIHCGSMESEARPRPAFAHASEAEMARILDFYAVRWDYEPHLFPILWNLDGDVLESFAPDFYLPDLDLYLEMTTLKQRLVRKKNRKLRRLRELYPDIRIKLFYARDFRMLMLKYGRLALLDDMSGTSGQVVPEPPDARGDPGPGESPRAVAPGLGARRRPSRGERRRTREAVAASARPPRPEGDR
jgi:hypothetical protein